MTRNLRSFIEIRIKGRHPMGGSVRGPAAGRSVRYRGLFNMEINKIVHDGRRG
jgi:hypothetical protein